ncbi:MAG: hypothetical protein GEV08_04170 [Acidimicrobiia bacterium]|nr:hypothetical protein [Acidimicrobiia bacterium]
MFTTGSKFCFGAGALLLVLAVLYGWTSGGVDWGLFPGALGDLYFQLLGALTFGWRGAVGDHLGYSLLVGGGLALFGVGGVLVAFRDADAEAIAEVARLPQAPVYRLPFSANYWAPVGAFALAITVLGLATSEALFFVGIALLLFTALEWAMQAWADRATGDPAQNARLRSRIMNPIEVPVVGALAVALVAVGMSRVMLAVSQLEAVWFLIGVAAAVFLVGVLVAAVPGATRGVLAAVVVVGALAVLGGGIGAAAVGEREFEHHEAEHSEAGAGGEAEADAEAEPGGAGQGGEAPATEGSGD